MDANNLQSFKFWKPDDVKEFFGVTRVTPSPVLEKWLAAECRLTMDEEKELHYRQQLLIDNVNDWKEEDLRGFFLAPIMGRIWLGSEKYRPFLESKLSVTIGNQTTQGKIDFLVATGRQAPRAPFYTLHEYKPEPGYTGYPLGQLLIAMVAAQKRNEEEGIDIPLYGTYVMGRFFFFVYFYKNQYALSRAYDATQDDLFKIYCIIKKVKDYIEANLKKM